MVFLIRPLLWNVYTADIQPIFAPGGIRYSIPFRFNWYLTSIGWCRRWKENFDCLDFDGIDGGTTTLSIWRAEHSWPRLQYNSLKLTSINSGSCKIIQWEFAFEWILAIICIGREVAKFVHHEKFCIPCRKYFPQLCQIDQIRTLNLRCATFYRNKFRKCINRSFKSIEEGIEKQLKRCFDKTNHYRAWNKNLQKF